MGETPQTGRGRGGSALCGFVIERRTETAAVTSGFTRTGTPDEWWNELPADVRTAESLTGVGERLGTRMFWGHLDFA